MIRIKFTQDKTYLLRRSNMNDNDIKKFIYNELSKFNFKRETKGFKYLCDAIFICIKDENALDNLSKNVFPQIAKKYNEKSFFKVKWCIEQVLKTMYNNTKISIINNYFSIDENLKPSLKFIIYTIVCKFNKKIN
ncbi:MAG TPA: hypothetical protein DIU30_01630 [Clostridiales bacterium]|nr:hypothetical protein [Clostridiales bacterium]